MTRTTAHPKETCSIVKVAPRPSAATDAKSKPRPAHHSDGRFKNPWPSFRELGFNPGIAMTIWRETRSNPLPPASEMPAIISPPNWGLEGQAKDGAWKEDIKATWMGHASFLLELPAGEFSTVEEAGVVKPRGVRILTDPVWSQRCSPSQWIGPARFTQPPLALADIPAIDFIVLSHNHYDHLDIPTLRHLASAQPAESLHVFAPLGHRSLLCSPAVGFKPEQLTELDWWEEATAGATLPGPTGGVENRTAKVRLTCVPAQHMTARGIFDRYKSLWGGWVIEDLGAATAAEERPAALSKSYFVGDTAYQTVPDGSDPEEMPCCPAFKEIGDKFGGFDLSMIPIGAYSPRDFMSRVHVNPEQAVRIHQDVKSRRSVAMHHLTWRLTGEPVLEPTQRLRAETRRLGFPEREFEAIEIGRTVRVRPRERL